MGDRVLFQVVHYTATKPEFSPAIYCHWSGSQASTIVARLVARMLSTRPGDVSYWAARLAQECTNNDPGALSFGLWNVDHILTAEDSHGDAGVVIIDAATGRTTCLGGYWRTDHAGRMVEC